MDIKCTLETRKSKKGTDYEVLVLKLSESCEKLVFLDPAEIELLKIYQKQKNSSPIGIK